MLWRSLFGAAALLVSGSVARRAGAQDTGYSWGVVTGSFGLDSADASVREQRVRAAFESRSPVPPQVLATVREELYLLIDSRIRRGVAGTRGGFFPGDSSLARLFDETTRLGLLGSGLVADSMVRDLSTGITRTIAPTVLPQPPLVLRFVPPLYELSDSSAGWRLHFPYYFMISVAQRAKAAPGIETDEVMLSTLFGPPDRNSSPAVPASQATILFLSVRHADSAAFVQYWLQAFGVQASDRGTDAPVPDAAVYRAWDAGQHLRKEIVQIHMAQSELLIAYIGLASAFDANHSHFVAFLRAIDR